MAVIKTEDWESSSAVIKRYPDRWWDTNLPALWPDSSFGAVMYASSDNPYAGSKSLKSVFTGTQYDAVPPMEERAILYFDASYDEIWVTWYEWLSPGFITGGDARIGAATTKGWYLLTNTNKSNMVFVYQWGGKEMRFGVQAVADATPPYQDGYTLGHNVTSRPQPDAKWICYEARIKWNTPGVADAVYELYYTNMTDAPGTTVQVANFTGMQWRGPNTSSPTPSNTRWFAIESYKQDGVGTRYTDNLTVSTTRIGATGTPPVSDTTPPPVPSAPTVGSTLPLQVSWPAVTNPGDLAGYKYYRKLEACAGGGGYTLVATLGNVTSYSDTTIPQDTTNVCVKVSSYDTNGNESAQSTGVGTALTPPVATTRTQLASDFFAGGDADLGVDWDAGYTGSGAFKIVSNEAVAANLNTDVRETYNAITTPNDQWLQAKITKFTANGGGGVLLRWANAPTVTGYFLKARPSSPSTRIDKYTAGVYANITGNDLVTWAVGDYIRAEVEGTNLRVYHIRAGVETQVLNATDSSFASGKVGLSLYSGSQNDMAFDDITIGGFGAAGDTFAHIATVVSDSSGADLTFTGLAYKIRYRNDLHPITPVEVTGLGGVDTYRLNKTWEPEITFVCIEAQGSDGVWETDINPESYICTGVTPSVTDTTAPDAPTGLEFY